MLVPGTRPSVILWRAFLCIVALGGCGTVFWETAHKEGFSAYQRGVFSTAEKQYLAALKAIEFEGEDQRLAITLNDLALLYATQRRFAEAEPLYRRALAVWEKIGGPERQGVATTLNNMGMLYRDQRKYVEAEPFLRRSLAIREKILPPHHRNSETVLTISQFSTTTRDGLPTPSRFLSARFRSWKRLPGRSIRM